MHAPAPAFPSTHPASQRCKPSVSSTSMPHCSVSPLQSASAAMVGMATPHGASSCATTGGAGAARGRTSRARTGAEGGRRGHGRQMTRRCETATVTASWGCSLRGARTAVAALHLLSSIVVLCWEAAATLQTPSSSRLQGSEDTGVLPDGDQSECALLAPGLHEHESNPQGAQPAASALAGSSGVLSRLLPNSCTSPTVDECACFRMVHGMMSAARTSCGLC